MSASARARSFLVFLGHLLCYLACTAQQVSPAVMEYPDVAAGGKVEGHFELANDSLQPLFVTIEAKSFTIDKAGHALFTP